MHTFVTPRTPDNTPASRPFPVGLGFTLGDDASPFPQHLSDSPLVAPTMSLTGSITPSRSRWSSSPGSAFSVPSSPSSSACPSPCPASKPHQRTVSSPLLPSLAPSAFLAPSPPLIPLRYDVKQAAAGPWRSTFEYDYMSDGLEEQDMQTTAADAGVYCCSQNRKRTALLPSVAILPSLLPACHLAPPGSPLLHPRARLCPSPATPLTRYGQEHGKRKRCATSPGSSAGSVSLAGDSARTGSSGKRFKSSPAIQHLGIFTRAAFAQADELAQAHSDVATELEALDMDMEIDGDAAPGSPSPSASSSSRDMRSIDLDILVADSPDMHLASAPSDDDAASSFANSVGGSPATPRSTVLPGLTFSTSLASASSWTSSGSASSTSTMSSLWDRNTATAASRMVEQDGPTFEEQIKADVQRRLRLSDVGLGIEHISLFPTGADWATIPSNGRMTVVVHTA